MNRDKVLGILALILGVIWAYVGFRYTYYSLGIYLTPFVVGISAIASGLIIVWKKSWYKNFLPLFYIANILLFSYLLISEGIRNYKPTVTVHIPENYYGMVHVFVGKGDQKDVFIDQNGIGYFQFHGEVNWEILQGEEDITDVLNEGGYSQLLFWESDSSAYDVVKVTCFELIPDRKYPTTPWNNKHSLCMDENTYLEWVKDNRIDEQKLIKTRIIHAKLHPK